MFDIQKNLFLLFYCQYKFLMNDYPIVFFEDDNSGGYVIASMIFQEIIQNLYNNQMKCSIKLGKYTNTIINEYDLDYMFLKENGDLYENIQELLNDNITEKLSESNYNQRLKQRPFILHQAQFYKDYIIKTKYKKPTEIIIFTDGFSCGATSMFIKSLYNFGGAILVGYSGDPETEKNNFDASQSPTITLSEYYLNYSIPSYQNLIKNGFNISQIAYIPTYKNQYVEGKLDYPEEFQITPVDERIDIYDEYYDYLYQDFIDKAKEIFKKYNEDNICNPDNKNLKMLSKDCDKFYNKYTHGGYECGDDGKWSTTCKPFYCHKNYYFDYVNQECVKDVIAEKYSIQYIESEEEEVEEEEGKEEEVEEEEVEEEEGKEEEKEEEEEGKEEEVEEEEGKEEEGKEEEGKEEEEEGKEEEVEEEEGKEEEGKEEEGKEEEGKEEEGKEEEGKEEEVEEENKNKKINDLNKKVKKYKNWTIFLLIVLILIIMLILICVLKIKFKIKCFKQNNDNMIENSSIIKL